jgi:hypothetical protein
VKLTAIQWLWMSAVACFAASLVLDLADILDVPPIYMLLGSTLLLVSGWWVMPSITEIGKARRRRL